MKETVKNLAAVVPVAKVPVLRKLVPQVSVKLVAPAVVMENVISWPTAPAEAPLNVQAPVGVIVTILVAIGTDIAPVVAGAAASPIIGGAWVEGS
jgi:hypothetical protein